MHLFVKRHTHRQTHTLGEITVYSKQNRPSQRITNRQKLLTFYCQWLFILTLRTCLIMPQTSDDSLFAPSHCNWWPLNEFLAKKNKTQQFMYTSILVQELHGSYTAIEYDDTPISHYASWRACCCSFALLPIMGLTSLHFAATERVSAL